eukprot:939363-Prymnesium_polylepis.1
MAGRRLSGWRRLCTTRRQERLAPTMIARPGVRRASPQRCAPHQLGHVEGRFPLWRWRRQQPLPPSQ